MRRPFVGSLAVAAWAMVGLLALTGAAGQLGLLVLVPAVGVVGVVAHRWRPDGGGDTAWSAPAPAPQPATEAGAVVTVAGAGAGASGTPAAVARALGRVEARELLRSPWFGTGVGLTLVPFLALVLLWGGENGVSRYEFSLLAPWLVHPLVGMLVVAAHRSATRARRDRADELVESCPTAAATRTAGLLRAAWVGLVVPLGFLALYAAGLYLRSPDLWGAPGLDAVPVVLAAAALGAGGVALGAALGRWVPYVLAPVLAVIAVGMASLRIDAEGDPGWNRWAALATAPAVPDPDPGFFDLHPWSHLAWIAGLVVLVGAVAMLHDARDRRSIAIAAIAGVLVVAAAATAVRPMSDGDAARLAAAVAAAPATQTCVEAAAGVEVCGYRRAREVLESFAGAIGPVVRALPVGATLPTVRQRFDGDLVDLPPEVRDLVPAGALDPGPGEIVVGFEQSAGELRAARMRVALTALGLPVEAGREGRPLVIAGQARGIVTFWLAARGLSADDARRLASVDPVAEPAGPFFDGYTWPGTCGLAPVVWSAPDLAAARLVLALPEADVARVVTDDFARWRDDATGTDELLAALDLPPGGPYPHLASRPVETGC
jgi:hypothetical protein